MASTSCVYRASAVHHACVYHLNLTSWWWNNVRNNYVTSAVEVECVVADQFGIRCMDVDNSARHIVCVSLMIPQLADAKVFFVLPMCAEHATDLKHALNLDKCRRRSFEICCAFQPIRCPCSYHSRESDCETTKRTTMCSCVLQ